ncbi:MAG: ABC-F family ATP-binding cassette domain-containing protein [Lachnospiraceae bacterium]|nr:ABC-F family ATP-binding cassette domain-containing protein [Lachnospiraceae bacterium]
MNLLNFENISKTFEDRCLLNKVVFGLDEQDKIGVIGVNGEGKSTLLNIAAGVLEPDEGEVIARRGMRISYLAQNPEFDSSRTLLENVTALISGRDAYWDTDGEARAMLQKFGIEDPDVDPAILSGGQKKRAALAAALLTPADLLILDEPTNHLDSGMIEYLQSFLEGYKGALLLVTHDRYFLDQVTEKILEIDKGKVYTYETNYEGYLELKAQRLSDALATERKMAALYKKDLAWIMRGARARSTKQKAHIQRFEALRDREKIVEERNMEMSSISSRLGGKTIECDGLGKRYGDKVLFEDFTYHFLKNDRIGIIGPNGCGKSTLLKLIIGQEMPDTGSIEIGQTVKIGYFGQENDSLATEGTVISVVKEHGEFVRTQDGLISAARMCERFLFDGNRQYTPIAKLSGGEKRRLYLLQILMEAPNVLILDEPTNDLDIQTLRVLEDYLDTFAGIVITVSHDRYFLDRVVNRIFSFEPGGIIRQSEGGYLEYRERHFASLDVNTVGAPAPRREKTEAEKKAGWKDGPKEKKRLSYKEQREYDTIEAEIEALEEKSAELEEAINGAGSDYETLQKLYTEKEETDQKLEERMERYLELQDLVDSFSS